MSRSIALVVLPFLLLAPLAIRSQEPDDPGVEPEPKREKRIQKAIWDPPPGDNVDLYGDDLPEGARARIGSTRFRHESGIDHLLFSPDGKILAVAGGGSRSVTSLFDTTTGRRLGRLTGEVMPIVFFQGGKMLATVGNGRVSFWKLGRTAGTPTAGPEADECVPCGAGRLALRYQGRIAIWDLAQQKIVARFGDNCSQMTVAGDGSRVAAVETADRKLALKLWDPITGKLVKELFRDFPSHDLYQFAFLPDNRHLISVVRSGRMPTTLWSAETGDELARKDNSPWALRNERTSPDGQSHVGLGIDEITMFDVQTDRGLWRRASDRSGLGPACFSPDGARLAIAEAWRVRLFETRSGREILAAGDNEPFHFQRLSADGKTVATQSVDGHGMRKGRIDEKGVRLWDTSSGAALEPATPLKLLPAAIQMTKDLGAMACLRGEQRLETWNLQTGKKLSDIAIGSERTTVFRVSGDLATFVKIERGEDSSAPWIGDLCDSRTGERLVRLFESTQFPFPIFSPDSRFLAMPTGGPEVMSKVAIFDIAARKWKHTFKNFFPLDSTCFSADGRMLALVGHLEGSEPADRSSICFFDLDTGKPHPVPAKSALGEASWRDVYNPTFLPGNRRFLTSNFDSVTLWDRVDGRRLKTWPIEVDSIQVSDDGRTLATFGGRGIVIWDLAEMIKGL